MTNIRIVAKGPIIRLADGCELHVTQAAFKDNPGKVYDVPDTPFFHGLIKAGLVKPAPEQKPNAAPAQQGQKPKA